MEPSLQLNGGLSHSNFERKVDQVNSVKIQRFFVLYYKKLSLSCSRHQQFEYGLSDHDWNEAKIYQLWLVLTKSHLSVLLKDFYEEEQIHKGARNATIAKDFKDRYFGQINSTWKRTGKEFRWRKRMINCQRSCNRLIFSLFLMNFFPIFPFSCQF